MNFMDILVEWLIMLILLSMYTFSLGISERATGIVIALLVILSAKTVISANKKFFKKFFKK